MIGWASINWCRLSLFESSNHSVVYVVGQHVGVVNQSMINCRINHLLKFTRIRVKGNLPKQREILLLDDFSTPAQAERLQTKLHVLLCSLFHSLLVFFFEIDFYHTDDVVSVELRPEHVDHVDLSHERAKRCVDAKVDLQTQRANTRF